MTESELPKDYRSTGRFFRGTLLPNYGQGAGPIAKRPLPARLYRSFLIYQTTLKTIEELKDKIRHAPNPADHIERQLTQMLQTITSRVTVDFITVSQLAWIREVSIYVGSNSELSIALVLANDRRVEPSQILSEASLDLLALLILVEVHIECAELGQSRVIILDDVFQSVDSVNRIRALSHILSRLSGWQVILTLHDRLWLELAIKAMQRTNFAYAANEVLAGGFGKGPTIRPVPGRGADELRYQIENRESSETIAASSGRVLEELCDNLSITLATKIARRPNDRYTIGDLWPGVASALRKYGTPAMKQATEGLAGFVDLRNLVGSHYNEFAASLSSKEALEFGLLTLNVWASSKCPVCGAYFGKFTSTDGKVTRYGFLCACAASIPRNSVDH
jgi:hypothetical protein